MSNSREKLLPWLVKKLDRGNVSGLRWTDKREGTFQILWKRNTTNQGNELDFQIFKEWAIHTHRYKEDKPEYPYWKTLFRNAMNKQANIIEMKEMYTYSKKDDPYRFFQIKEFTSSVQPKELMQNMPISFIPHNSEVPTLLNEYNEVPRKEEEMEISSITQHPETFSPYFNVTVKVGDQVEKEQKICSSCLIKTGNYIEGDYMKESSDFLCLQLDSLSQEPIGQKIINGLKRGIEIFVDDEMNIFAKRSCQCRIYYITQNENQEFNNLKRFETVKIFDFKTFLAHLDRKLNGTSKIIPQSNILMSVGQPCVPNMNNILLSITITSCKAEEILMELNFTKPNSILMSDPDSIDRIQSQINNVEEEYLKSS